MKRKPTGGLCGIKPAVTAVAVPPLCSATFLFFFWFSTAAWTEARSLLCLRPRAAVARHRSFTLATAAPPLPAPLHCLCRLSAFQISEIHLISVSRYTDAAAIVSVGSERVKQHFFVLFVF